MISSNYTQNKKRLFTFLRFFTLLLFIGVMIFIYLSQVNVFWQNTFDHITLTSEKHSEILHIWFVPKMKLVNMVHDDLIYFELTENDEFERYFTHITNANAITDRVMATYIAMDDKVIIFSDGHSPPEGFDPTVRVWYTAAKANRGNATISKPYVDILTGEIIITVCKTITLVNGVEGVIGIDFALTDVIAYVDAIRPYTSGTSFLLSETGDIITHANTGYLPWKADGSAFFINYVDILTGYISNVDNNSSRVVLERIITQGDEKFVSRIEIEEIGWVLGSEIPVSDFDAQMRNITLPLVATLAIGVLIFVLGAIFSFLHENALIKITVAQKELQEMLKSENRAINRQLSLQGEHYSILQTHIAETKRAEHDLRHHLSVIQSYNNAGDNKKLEEYLNDYIGSMPVKTDMTFCDNFAVSSLLQYYTGIAKRDNIEIDVSTVVPAETGVSDSDLCIIFGNCVENAIEACRKLDGEKFVKIRSMHTGKLLTINISNSFDGTLNKDGERFISRKHEGEGIGISSVKAVVDKYGESARFEADGNVFRAVIILRVG